jgi:hypothetical protein
MRVPVPGDPPGEAHVRYSGRMQTELFAGAPSPAPPPVRFAPLCSDDASVERANREQGRRGVGRYPPILKASGLASNALNVHPDRLEAWARHPDERVPIALLRNSHLQRTEPKRVTARVLDRLVGQTPAEELWNPLADELLQRGWAFIGSPTQQWAAERLIRLGAWARSATTTEIAQLFAFSAPEVLELAVAETPVVDQTLVRAAAAHEAGWSVARAMVAHPRLSQDGLQAMVAISVGLGQGAKSWAPWLRGEILHAALDRGHALSDHERTALGERMRESPQSFLEVVVHPGFARSEEDLLAPAIMNLGAQFPLRRICEHPMAGPRLWMQTLARDPLTARLLVEIPAARYDPEVRRRLSRSRSAPVMLALAMDDREDARRHFTRALRAQPGDTLDALARRETPPEWLRVEDVVPFIGGQELRIDRRARLLRTRLLLTRDPALAVRRLLDGQPVDLHVLEQQDVARLARIPVGLVGDEDFRALFHALLYAGCKDEALTLAESRPPERLHALDPLKDFRPLFDQGDPRIRQRAFAALSGAPAGRGR